MPDPNKVVEVLRAALAKMNDDGAHWAKQYMRTWNEDDESMFCSLGAVFEVTGVNTWRYEEMVTDGEDPSVLLNDGDVVTREAAVRALAEAVLALPGSLQRDALPQDITAARYDAITYWNDSQAKSWDEVRDVFAKAEEIALKGEKS